MSVSYDFSGRRAVVTGGANGIGAGVAERLSDAGAIVTIWDLSEPAGGVRPGQTFQQVDVSDTTQVATATAALGQSGNTLDILVHCAGILGPSAPTVDYDPAMWRKIIDVNLVGTYEVTRHLVPMLVASPAGRIVNLASIAGKEGTPNASAYSASKAAVIGYTKALAKELIATNVRVNSIAPGPIETGMLAQVSPEHVQTMISKCPMGRLASVEEAAEAIMWMVSDGCTYSSGVAFDLSGGRAVY
jgi:NAD(P)-dependent dehydrogenase (short-subunit alcohol dehydrogenase family)